MTPTGRDQELLEALDRVVDLVGQAQTLDILRQVSIQKNINADNTLTIVANEGVHHLPAQYRRGKVLAASRGSLDFSSAESVHQEFTSVLRKVAAVLKSREWRRIYVIPFGPAALSMELKLLIYRVTGLEAAVVMQMPDGSRADIAIPLRQLILDAADKET